MSHFVLELALWTLLAFFLGCIGGCILRKLFASGETAALSRAPSVAAPIIPSPSIPIGAEEIIPTVPTRPKGIAAARSATPDNLQRISGIAAGNERTLHNLGFFHFDQIAAWTPEEVAWVDDHLKFGGRIAREKWVTQARLLAEGKNEEFERRYGTGANKG